MRWLYLTIVCLLGVATLVFAFENMEIVSMDFLWFTMRLPLAFLVVVIYLVGMMTGADLVALVRAVIRRAKKAT